MAKDAAKQATAQEDKGAANRKKSATNKSKDTTNKTRSTANVETIVIDNLVKMLDKHFDELGDALEERHDEMIADLLYDLVPASNRSKANSPACRKDHEASKSPSETIEAAGSKLAGDVANKGVKAKPKAGFVKPSFRGRKNR